MNGTSNPPPAPTNRATSLAPRGRRGFENQRDQHHIQRRCRRDRAQQAQAAAGRGRADLAPAPRQARGPRAGRPSRRAVARPVAQVSSNSRPAARRKAIDRHHVQPARNSTDHTGSIPGRSATAARRNAGQDAIALLRAGRHRQGAPVRTPDRIGSPKPEASCHGTARGRWAPGASSISAGPTTVAEAVTSATCVGSRAGR